jgi:hypothetical protein
MRRAALLILLSACASGGNSTDTITAKPQTIYAGDQSTARLEGDKPRASAMNIAAPVAVVWAAAKQAYASVGIPVAFENQPGHQLGNQNFYQSRQLGGEPMTSMVDCGNGMTGAKAASYRIYMSLFTDIKPDDKGGTLVQMTFTALGQDMSGVSSDRIPCGTTGHLEQILLDRTKAAVLLR